MKNKLLTGILFSLFVAELVLVFVSWFLSASQVYGGVRSLISDEAARWFFGGFASMISAPSLVWLLLLSMSFGCISRSGILFRSRRSGLSSYRLRLAAWLAASSLFVFVAVYALLAFAPHAALRSVTGELFPSPFSASLVPALSFAMILSGMVYGVVSGSFRSISSAFDSLFAGISFSAPFVLLYIMLAQLYYSFRFVFG